MTHRTATIRTLILSLSAIALLSASVTAQSVAGAPMRFRPGFTPQPPVNPQPPTPILIQPVPTVVPVSPQCSTGDCVPFVLSTQDRCQMFDRQATGDARWAQGLSTSIDSELFVEQRQQNWDVVAYRIRWSNGAWSDWLVTGINDIDHKFNPGANTLRRMWSYFADHEHQALACHRPQ